MMKRATNLSNEDSVTRLDENFSRLLKLTDESNKPSRIFTESLINGALNDLKKQEVKKAEAKIITIQSKWLEKAMGWVAMITVACGAGLIFVISIVLKMNLLLEVIVVLTMVFNWIRYFGEQI